MNNNELYHYGKKGMKWGQHIFTDERLEGARVGKRRYQNKDGSLTARGQLRYERDAREKEFNNYDESTGKYYKSSKKNGRTDLEADASRYAKEDMERSKRLVEANSRMINDLDRINNKAMKNKPAPKMDLSKMTQKQMRDEINRAYLERQYSELFSPQKEKKGREYAKKTFEVLGNTLAITGSALSIALAIKELRG